MDFYDAVTPANIPEGAHACLYYDGEFAATAEQAKRFSAVRWISVLGGVAAAAHTGCLDYERYNASYDDPGRLRDWVATRRTMGARARVYCDGANLALVRQQLVGLEYLIWLATLDGDKLSADYTPGLWAVQYQGGVTADFDVSWLYGVW
jgi:hypothetical protein